MNNAKSNTMNNAKANNKEMVYVTKASVKRVKPRHSNDPWFNSRIIRAVMTGVVDWNPQLLTPPPMSL